MTGTRPKNGVVELFPSTAPEQHSPNPGDDANWANVPDGRALEAIALIQKKLEAQISLIASARATNRDLPDLRTALTEIKELTGSIIDDLNRVIPTLDNAVRSLAEEPPQTDLFTRLTQLCSGFRASSGIACVLAVLPRHVVVDTVANDILFRAVRELLTNVRQHSHANRVEITSEVRADGSVLLTVKDDGIGMPPGGSSRSALDSGAVGLSSIELRLREIDAHMEIESDRGVEVRLVLPAHIVAADGDPPNP